MCLWRSALQPAFFLSQYYMKDLPNEQEKVRLFLDSISELERLLEAIGRQWLIKSLSTHPSLLDHICHRLDSGIVVIIAEVVQNTE